jgi:serine/threonine protein kinase
MGSAFCAHCGYRLVQPTGAQAYALPYAAAAAPVAPPRSIDIPAEVSGNIPAGTLLKRRYRIMRKIAQGGMGAVYECSDTLAASSTRWAVKEMSPAALPAIERTQAIADFRREAQMLAALHHPNLPLVVETFEEMGKNFLILEFIPGRTLLNLIESTPGFLPEERVMVWARQLFDVIEYLHSQNPPIIYRDLKPANIMLIEGTERIKVIDFGIARFHKAGKARDTEAFGTAGYAPPEQYGKGQTDQRSDIYALAATLHYLVTGHDPSLSPFNWLPVRRYNPALSPRLESALNTALSLDPLRRFATVDEFAHALGFQMYKVPQATPQLIPQRMPVVQPAPQAPVQAPTHTTQPKSPSKRKAQSPPPTTDASANPPAVTHTPTQKSVAADATAAAPPAEKKGGKTPALLVSERMVDLGEARWNSKPMRRISLRGSGGPVRGTVLASQPWIAYNPAHFQGNAVTLEVKVKHMRLPFGRVKLQVPNLFAIIWARTRRILPLIGFWFWVLLLAVSSLGRTLLWGLAATVGTLLLLEGLMWLWAMHVQLLVPAAKLNTGRLLVKSSGGDQQIEVRVVARPSSIRRAFGWSVALVLFMAELAAAAWIVLLLAGWDVPLLGL